MQSLLAPQQYIIRVIDELYWAISYAKSIRGYMYIICVVTDKKNWKMKIWWFFPSKGDLVYVNYGRIEDFLYLTQNMSIDLKGKTLIARYGKIFRGDKVRLTHAFC